MVRPRFGHNRDINLFIDEDASDQEDYIMGLVAGSIVMFFFFFLVWIAILIIFKGCGPSRVGFWSGSIMPLPGEPLPGEPSPAEQLPAEPSMSNE
jgi:hypothetical protein